MTNYQNSFFQMCAAVKATADAHTTAWTNLVPFASNYTPFLTLLAQTNDALALQEKSSTGSTESKSIVRKNLTDKLEQLADILVLFGKVNNDTQLAEDAQMSRSEIDKLTEKALVGHALKLQTLAAPGPVAAAVALYSNSTTFITDTALMVTKFTTAIGGPRHIIAESMRGTEDLERIITQIRAKLDIMDAAAHGYCNIRNPLFFRSTTLAEPL
jgi:hypothetical protein